MTDTYDYDRADHDQREADIGDEIAERESITLGGPLHRGPLHRGERWILRTPGGNLVTTSNKRYHLVIRHRETYGLVRYTSSNNLARIQAVLRDPQYHFAGAWIVERPS